MSGSITTFAVLTENFILSHTRVGSTVAFMMISTIYTETTMLAITRESPMDDGIIKKPFEQSLSFKGSTLSLCGPHVWQELYHPRNRAIHYRGTDFL
jgi:hypothetical protein